MDDQSMSDGESSEAAVIPTSIRPEVKQNPPEWLAHRNNIIRSHSDPSSSDHQIYSGNDDEIDDDEIYENDVDFLEIGKEMSGSDEIDSSTNSSTSSNSSSSSNTSSLYEEVNLTSTSGSKDPTTGSFDRTSSGVGSGYEFATTSSSSNTSSLYEVVNLGSTSGSREPNAGSVDHTSSGAGSGYEVATMSDDSSGSQNSRTTGWTDVISMTTSSSSSCVIPSSSSSHQAQSVEINSESNRTDEDRRTCMVRKPDPSSSSNQTPSGQKSDGTSDWTSELKSDGTHELHSSLRSVSTSSSISAPLKIPQELPQDKNALVESIQELLQSREPQNHQSAPAHRRSHQRSAVRRPPKTEGRKEPSELWDSHSAASFWGNPVRFANPMREKEADDNDSHDISTKDSLDDDESEVPVQPPPRPLYYPQWRAPRLDANGEALPDPPAAMDGNNLRGAYTGNRGGGRYQQSRHDQKKVHRNDDNWGSSWVPGGTASFSTTQIGESIENLTHDDDSEWDDGESTGFPTALAVASEAGKITGASRRIDFAGRTETHYHQSNKNTSSNTSDRTSEQMDASQRGGLSPKGEGGTTGISKSRAIQGRKIRRYYDEGRKANESMRSLYMPTAVPIIADLRDNECDLFDWVPQQTKSQIILHDVDCKRNGEGHGGSANMKRNNNVNNRDCKRDGEGHDGSVNVNRNNNVNNINENDDQSCDDSVSDDEKYRNTDGETKKFDTNTDNIDNYLNNDDDNEKVSIYNDSTDQYTSTDGDTKKHPRNLNDGTDQYASTDADTEKAHDILNDSNDQYASTEGETEKHNTYNDSTDNEDYFIVESQDDMETHDVEANFPRGRGNRTDSNSSTYSEIFVYDSDAPENSLSLDQVLSGLNQSDDRRKGRAPVGSGSEGNNEKTTVAETTPSDEVDHTEAKPRFFLMYTCTFFFVLFVVLATMFGLRYFLKPSEY